MTVGGMGFIPERLLMMMMKRGTEVHGTTLSRTGASSCVNINIMHGTAVRHNTGQLTVMLLLRWRSTGTHAW